MATVTKFKHDSDETQYRDIYQTLLTLSLFGFEIKNDIASIIAEFATGAIFECNNNWCNNEILFLNQHKRDQNPDDREKQKPSRMRIRQPDGTSEIVEHPPHPEPQHKIPDRSYTDNILNIKYYYDNQQNIAFCDNCYKHIKLCGKSSANANANLWPGIICDGIIFDTDVNNNDSFVLCACQNQKRMCKKHSICSRCNRSACHDHAGDGNCNFRSCDTCSANGCINCISMISCDGRLDSYPPQYINPIYKCLGDGCQDVIKTVFENDKDYIAFKKTFDLLLKLKDITGISDNEKDILIHISEYSNGILLDCSTDKCDNEILILNEHKCMGKNSYWSQDRDKLKRFTFEDIKYELKYYYRSGGYRSKSIAFCNDCICKIGCCEQGSMEMPCYDMISNKNDNLCYNICNCKQKKKLCLKHVPCGRCNQYVCLSEFAQDLMNANFQFMPMKCGGRICSNCKYTACSNCIKYIGNNKFQCKDNGCVVNNKPDNKAFKRMLMGAFGMMCIENMDHD